MAKILKIQTSSYFDKNVKNGKVGGQLRVIIVIG